MSRITRRPARGLRSRLVLAAGAYRVDALEPRTMLAAAVAAVTTTQVDPADGLRLSVNDEKTAVVLGEWNTAGNAESWAVTGASATTVAGGLLTETAQTAGTPVVLSRTSIASGPQTLEYGYYDYVQLRLKLPTGYAGGDVTFYYGTSNTVPSSQAGFAAARSWTIPASQLATDGAMHTYRINVGKSVWWKANLTDLRVSVPVTAAGQSVALDYVEVGDLPNSTLPASPATAMNGGGYLQYDNSGVTPGSSTIHVVLSKHFAYYYDTGVNPGGVNQTTAAHNTLEILEQSERLYTQVLGFRDVYNWAAGVNGDTARYKLNVTSWYPGYFSGGSWLNVDTSGANNTTSPGGYSVTMGPGSPIPHELGHVVDSQNGSYLAGGHFESHANWYREQWANWYSAFFTSVGYASSAYTSIAQQFSNLHQDNARLIYNDYRIYTPLQYYAESMGLDPTLVAKLWSTGATNLTAYAKLASLLPAGVSVKDVAAKLMAYWPTLDFPVRTQMQNSAFAATNGYSSAQQLANFNYLSSTVLEADADDGWYTVPLARAPESYAYSTHVLTPTAGSNSVTVSLRGLASTDATADWRAVLVDVSGYGTANPVVNSYSDPIAAGSSGTINLATANSTVLLVVTATPGNTALDLNSFDNTVRSTQGSTRQVYPYQVLMTGATPAIAAAARIGYTRGSGAYRTNPDGSAGGWVDSTATVAAGAYIAPGAQVLGTANIGAIVRIEDYATVAGTAKVSGTAVVSGYAVVAGNAVVSGNARVRDHAFVGTGATVTGNGTVEQYAYVSVYGSVTVTDNAIVRGVATPTGGTLSGTAIVEYDYTSDFNLSNGVNANNHPYDNDFNTYYSQTQTKPTGLFASYRVNETGGSTLFDEYGSLNAVLRGSPARTTDATTNSQVLTLNGSSQYALLDRSIAEVTNGTYSLWIKPNTTTADQALLYFGSSANTYLKLVGRNASGFAQLTISVNGVVETLTSTVAVPANAWTNLVLTFNNKVATFYINGVAAGTTGSTGTLFRPADVLSGDLSAAQAIYLGRDAAGNFFSGQLDDARFYNVALSATQIASEIKRSGVVLGSFYADAPATFNGTSTKAESGVHSGFTRTFSAWIKPAASPSVTNTRFNVPYYTPIVDSTDDRDATGYGNGLGINNGKFAVRLDNSLQIWDTGIAVTLGQWQQVTLTLSGTTANLYINGVLRATRNYTSNNVNGKNYRIGYGQTTTDTASRTYFNGQIFNLQISDKVTAPATTLPAGWTAAQVGTGSAGTTSYGGVGNVFAVNGAGGGVNGAADNYRFTYTTESGTGQVSALVTNPFAVTGTVVSTAQAGVMIRASTATGSANAFLAQSPAGGLTFTYRSTTGGSTTTAATLTSVTGPVWLKLTRTGTSVSAFYSTDGVTYTQLGPPVTVAGLSATSQLAGLAVASRSTTQLDQSTFTNVSVTSTTGPSIVSGPTASAVVGKTFSLSTLAADPAGEAGLTYAWTQINPTSLATLSANNSNAAKNTTVTVYGLGTYAFRVAAYNAAGQVVLSSVVSVTVNSQATTISPATASVVGGGSQQFSVTDQFGNAVSAGGVTWTTNVGTISSTGLFTAPLFGATTATVTAVINGVAGASAVVSIATPIVLYQNDAITGTQVIDSSGNGRNATVTGTLNTTYSSTAGTIGNALTLAPTATNNGYVTLPTSFATAMSTVTDFTISGWVKETSHVNWARFFDFGTGTNKYMFLSPYNGAGVVAFAITGTGNGGEQQLTSSTTLTPGTWNFLAVTLSGTTATLYVNGVAVATNSNMTLNPAALGLTTQNWLGRSQFGDPNLKGSIDDFRVYAAAASGSTIASMYSAGVAAASHMPTVATAASASPSPVTGNTTTLSVLGAESAGESNLTYTWLATSGPAAVTYANNGNNAAKSTLATFTQSGTYTFRVTISDPLGYSATSTVSVAVTLTPPPTLTGFTINDGSTQRSMVRSLTVAFSQPVDLGANAIVLSGVSGNVASVTYTLTPSADHSTYTLTFTDPMFTGGSLLDGTYQLAVNAAAVTDASTGATLTSGQTYSFHRLFADGDGNGRVDFNDFLQLQTAYGTTPGNAAYNAAYDSDANSLINFNDFLALQTNYGVTL